MNGKEIKWSREEAGLTQEELAKIVGMTRKTINLYENGAPIKPHISLLFTMVFRFIVTSGYKREELMNIVESSEKLGSIVEEPRVAYETPSNHLEEKERAIKFLEQTIKDKEQLIEFQKNETTRLKNELNAFKSQKPKSKESTK